MSDSVHLLIPFAAATAAGCKEALSQLALPNLEKLLARLAPAGPDAGDEHTLSLPHEKVLAREYGLPAADGRIPWAAWQVRQEGREADDSAWAWITPCHWRVGTGSVAMDHPQGLQLTAAESRDLLSAIRPFFQEDGIGLEYEAPTLWLAHGEIFRGLATASLDRVVGRTIDPWLPRTADAGPLRRLQQEMQMLLYTHEVNEARVRGGLLPVNSFWTSGTGALPAQQPVAVPPGLRIVHYLRDAALLADWRAWAAAWQSLDDKEFARLLKSLGEGQAVKVTLCGERSAQTWTSAGGGGLLRRLGALVTRRNAAMLLDSL
jgi:hypothetical protein